MEIANVSSVNKTVLKCVNAMETVKEKEVLRQGLRSKGAKGAQNLSFGASKIRNFQTTPSPPPPPPNCFGLAHIAGLRTPDSPTPQCQKHSTVPVLYSYMYYILFML